MSLYKQKLNTRTGQFNLVPSNAVISFKPAVASEVNLPTEGNVANDARMTNDTQHLYVWDGATWIDQGDILDLTWAAISGKPSSSVADIDDAVSKKHSQGTDTDIKISAIPPLDHTSSGIKITLTAAQATNFGDVCYINVNGKAALIKADAIATMSGLVMCVDASIAGDAIGNFMLMGIARDDTWDWTVGGLIYGSITGTTGNTLTQTPPSSTDEVVQILGVATHADRMYFNPNLSQVEIA